MGEKKYTSLLQKKESNKPTTKTVGLRSKERFMNTAGQGASALPDAAASTLCITLEDGDRGAVIMGNQDPATGGRVVGSYALYRPGAGRSEVQRAVHATLRACGTTARCVSVTVPRLRAQQVSAPQCAAGDGWILDAIEDANSILTRSYLHDVTDMHVPPAVMQVFAAQGMPGIGGDQWIRRPA